MTLASPRLALVLAGLALGACTSTGDQTASAPPQGAIAFEAIDGAPAAVKDRLAGSLAGEAEARRIQVVARDAGPRYRLRGYMASARQGEAATVSYVFDVFDPERRRSTRIAGEERVAARGTDAWSGVDEAAASRIAARSMDQIAAWLAAPQSSAGLRTAEGAMTQTAGTAAGAADAAGAAPQPVESAAVSPAGTARVAAFASPAAAAAAPPPQSAANTGGPLVPLGGRP